MNVLIIEDEKIAADKLKRLLKEYDQNMIIVETLVSIEQSVSWLKEKQDNIDIIFMDIKLSDGLSFTIFNKVNIYKPIVFITAYSNFALEAFRSNGIDYILKPINSQKINNSIKKLQTFGKTLDPLRQKNQIEKLSKILVNTQKKYKTRFMVKVGQHIRSFTTDEISFFSAEGRNIFMHTIKSNAYIVDYRMEELEALLNPEQFFRVNRSYIVNIIDIKDVLIYSKSRLLVQMNKNTDEEIIVSREKVNLFKSWFNGEREILN